MNPSEGKVLIVNDDPSIVSLLETFLGMSGYETVSVVTKPAALEMLPKLGELGVGVALLDGNLSPSSTQAADGIEVNHAIKVLYHDSIWTIGTSVTDDIPEADIPQVEPYKLDDVLAAVEAL